MYNRYQKISQIECSCIEDLFNFHLDVQNIEKVSHPSLNTKVLNPQIQTKQGEVLHLQTRRFYISMVWEMEIALIEKPYKIVNIATKSPFHYWRHSHIFQEKDYGIEMIDQVEFIPPFGMVGKFLEPIIAKELDKMFEHRHQATIELLKTV